MGQSLIIKVSTGESSNINPWLGYPSTFAWAVPSQPDLLYINGQSEVWALNLTTFNDPEPDLVQVSYWYSTQYMLSFSYGVCDGTNTKVFVNVSSFASYVQICPKKDGFYYQGPNVWFDTPPACAGMQPDALLTKCPEVIENMRILVKNNCEASKPKLCHLSFTENPPFQCTEYVYLEPVIVVANAFANSQAAWSLVAVAVAVWFGQHFPKREMFNKKNSVVVMDDELKDLHEGYRVSFGAQ